MVNGLFRHNEKSKPEPATPIQFPRASARIASVHNAKATVRRRWQLRFLIQRNQILIDINKPRMNGFALAPR
jgi:hypothetical protein